MDGTTTKLVRLLNSAAELAVDTRYTPMGRRVSLVKVAMSHSHATATMEAMSVDAMEHEGEDDNALQQLLVEARLLLSLQEHPHIVQIQGVVSADRAVSMVSDAPHM